VFVLFIYDKCSKNKDMNTLENKKSVNLLCNILRNYMQSLLSFS
jgi:hypothetical protein